MAISQKIKNQVLHLYINEGLSYVDIALQLDVSKSTAHKIVTDAGYTKYDKGTGRMNNVPEADATPEVETPVVDSIKKHELLNLYINKAQPMTTLMKRFNLKGSQFKEIIESAGYKIIDCGRGGYSANNAVTTELPQGVTLDRQFNFGDVYYHNYGTGSRPCVLISDNDRLNNSNIQYVYITTTRNKGFDYKAFPNRVELENRPKIINQYLDLGFIEMVRKDSLTDYICTLTDNEKEQIRPAIAHTFNIKTGNGTYVELYNDPKPRKAQRGDIVCANIPYIDDNGQLLYKARPCVVISNNNNNNNNNNGEISVVLLSTPNSTLPQHAVNKVNELSTTITVDNILNKRQRIVIGDIRLLKSTEYKLTDNKIDDETMALIEQQMIAYYGFDIVPYEDDAPIEDMPQCNNLDYEKVKIERDIYKDVLYKLLEGKTQ